MEQSNRVQDRLNSFQHSLNQEVEKFKRENTAVELRRTKRLSNSSKKRALGSNMTYLLRSSEKENFTINQVPPSLAMLSQNLSQSDFPSTEKLKIIIQILKNQTDTRTIGDCLEVLTECVLCESESPIQMVIYMGVIQQIQKHLLSNVPSSNQYLACKALTNLSCSSTEQQNLLASYGVIRSFADIITNRNMAVTSLAIQGIGNLGSDSYSIKQSILEAGVIQIIDSLLMAVKDNPQELLVSIAHFLSNLADCLANDLKRLNTILQWVGRMISCQNMEVTRDLLYLLYKLVAQDSLEIIQTILSYNLGGFISSCLLHSTDEYSLSLALGITMNIMSFEGQACKSLLELGVLEKLLNILHSGLKHIQLKALGVIKNVTLGDFECVQHFLEHPVCEVSFQLINNPDLQIRKEAANIFIHVLDNGHFQHKAILVFSNQYVIQLMKCLEEEVERDQQSSLTLKLALAFLEEAEILTSNNGQTNTVVEFISENYGLEVFENLVSSRNQRISELAHDILDNLFQNGTNLMSWERPSEFIFQGQ